MNQFASHNYSEKFSNNKPLGQLLSEAGLISAQQIELALREQIINQPNTRIGTILASYGWIKQQTADFFVEKWHDLVNSEQKYPLVYYFREAGLLDEAQIHEILQERNSSQKLRFHHVAIKKGLIKRETVNFFIINLLSAKANSKNNHSSASTTAYELLTNYVKGETDFQRSQLKRIKLNRVTLKGVNLNYSNLTEAELKQANLSNSSLKSVNLTNANLEKAILKEADFDNAAMSRVNLTDAHLEGANFQGTNLTEADLRDGYFVNVCFFGADLRYAKLQGANLKGACYNSETCFDFNFNPGKTGMRLVF